MTNPRDTDDAWKEWGERDPYFGVITDPRFRASNLTPEVKEEFFESGRAHADYVMQMVRLYIDPEFQPVNALDFGCGVGRVTLPLAGYATWMTGVDVSPGMLAEARANRDARGVGNVSLLASDDMLSGIDGPFDFIHSYIVFQHIPYLRGRALIEGLLSRLSPGGVGALHFVYAKARLSDSYGLEPPQRGERSLFDGLLGRTVPEPGQDPGMQMNSYNANEILFLVQRSGTRRIHCEFTDHGGELGLFLFFQLPIPA